MFYDGSKLSCVMMGKVSMCYNGPMLSCIMMSQDYCVLGWVKVIWCYHGSRLCVMMGQVHCCNGLTLINPCVS